MAVIDGPQFWSRVAGRATTPAAAHAPTSATNFEPPATDDEVRAAALQYVRKISGFTKPSQANAEAFERAVEEVAARHARACSTSSSTTAPPKDREVEAAKARARAAERYAA